MTEVEQASAMDQEQRELDQHNADVQDRQYCKVCRTSVREGDYPFKYAAAGGALTGPFCSDDCYWRFMVSDDD